MPAEMNRCLNLTSSKKVVYLALFCILLLYVNLVATDGTEAEEGGPARPDTIPSECISFPEESCPSQDAQCPCISIATRTTHTRNDLPTVAPKPLILCCNLKDVAQLWFGIECATSKDGTYPTALHVRDSTLGSSALYNVSARLASLTSLAMTNGIAPNITVPLSVMVPKLSCLNLSSNGMGDLPNEALSGLSALRALDLSANNVTQLPRLPHGVDGQPLWIDISGNEHLGCREIQDAMTQNASSALPVDVPSAPPSPPPLGVRTTLAPSLPGSRFYFHNKKNTFCIKPEVKYWFNWTDRISLDDFEYMIKKHAEEWPSGEGYSCQLTVVRFEMVPDRPVNYAVSVDCSGRGLLDLPVKLPNHTIILNVSNNKISSLEPLGRNKYYSEIREFHADNNLITSIQVLEGSVFFDSFVALTLSGNKLKELPMYILQSIFDRNSVLRYMRLGKNKYNCDCNTYHGLRTWIVENKKNILDNEEMVCDAEEPPVKIIALQKEKVCLSKTDWMDYLPVVIAAEVLLLAGLVTKVSYDYWIFKTKGYLPWPASRTPKLPCCDWAFDA